MKKLLPLIALLFLAACAHHANNERVINRIAFGSCIDTNMHPMLDTFVKQDFDLALMIGDNIYADTTNMTVMRRKYDALKASPFWQALRKKAPVLATWDDHDFGANDAGGNYPMKRESQELFCDFMDEPKSSPLRQQEGIYHARIFGPAGKRVQILMLDTRYFRSNTETGINNVEPSGGKYVPTKDTNTTILGEKQWQWLEAELRKPAEVRVMVCSFQFISEFHGGEAWANFPHEKIRMLELISKTKANGVVFISGDRHWAELSKMPGLAGETFYDVTSSSLTQNHPRGTPTPNKYRDVSTTYHKPNMGMILIDWKNPRPEITLQVLDTNATVRIERTFTAQ